MASREYFTLPCWSSAAGAACPRTVVSRASSSSPSPASSSSLRCRSAFQPRGGFSLRPSGGVSHCHTHRAPSWLSVYSCRGTCTGGRGAPRSAAHAERRRPGRDRSSPCSFRQSPPCARGGMAPNGQPAATAECPAAPRGPGGGPSTPVAAVTRDAAALGPGAGTYVQAAGLKEAGHHGVLVSPQRVVDEVVPALGPEHPRGHVFASDRKAPGQKDTAHPWGPRRCRPKPRADTPRWRVETGQGCCLNPSVHLLGPGVSVDVCHCPSQGTAGGAPSTDQRALGAAWGACSSHLPDPPETPAERTLLTAETGPVGSGLRLSEDGRGLALGQPAYVAQTPVPWERDHCVLLTTAWWPPEDGRSRHPGGEEPPTPTTAPQMRRPGCSPHAGTEFVRDQVLLPGFSGQRQVVWTPPHPPGARPASGPQGAQGRTLRKLQGTVTVTSASPRAAGHGCPFRPIRVSPGVLCPVNARGLIVRPKVGFVQDKRVELPLPPGGVVQLSDVALCDDKLPTAETGATDTAPPARPEASSGPPAGQPSCSRPVSYDRQSWGPASHRPRVPVLL